MTETRADLAGQGTGRGFYFLLVLGVLTGIGFVALALANRTMAPEMYSRSGPIEIAEAFARGENYAVFDLNINIRELRDEHIKRMKKTPDIMVLGASHWQEAHRWLLPKSNFYNAHVHRDYYEDMLAMTEILVRHDRLPKRLIIAIRDKLFTPVESRTDHLWLPGVPYYRDMAKRLAVSEHSTWSTLPVPRWRELISLPMLYANSTRFANATVTPQATTESRFEDLDVLLPGGSIIWSAEHMRLFTQERSRRTALEFANASINDPPQIDPKGVKAIEALFDFLKSKGVEVILAHPPFNPVFYDHAMKGPYAEGLYRVEELTRDFARKYNWRIIGSFDPRVVGCTASMYIDAEHANPHCLSKLLAPVDDPRASPPANTPDPDDRIASLQLTSDETGMAGETDDVKRRPLPSKPLAIASASANLPAKSKDRAEPSDEVNSLHFYRSVLNKYAADHARPSTAARSVSPYAAPTQRLAQIAADVRRAAAPARAAARAKGQAVIRSTMATRAKVTGRKPAKTMRYPSSPKVVTSLRRVGAPGEAAVPPRQLVWPGDRQASAPQARAASQLTVRQ